MTKRRDDLRKNRRVYTLSVNERAARAHAQEKYQHARAVWPDLSSYGKSKPIKVIIYVLNLFGPNRFLSTFLMGFLLWFLVRYIGKVLWHFFGR